jgi:thioesterase domain-containing protein
MGGAIAFEMARQLRRLGQEVERVVLLDAAVPDGHLNDHGAGELDEASLLAWFARDLGALANVEVGLSADDLRRLDPEAQVRYLGERIQAAGALPADVDLTAIRSHLDIFRINARALTRYRPDGRYAGALDVFPAAEGEHGAGAEWESWAEGGARVHAVSGNHYTLLRKPQVRDLAERLRRCLE